MRASWRLLLVLALLAPAAVPPVMAGGPPNDDASNAIVVSGMTGTISGNNAQATIDECQWLQYLHSVGLLRAAFRPDGEVCAVRVLMRHRSELVAMASQHVSRANIGMAGKGHLGRAMKDANTGIIGRIVGGQNEGCLAVVHLRRQRLHLCGGKPARIGEDGELRGWLIEAQRSEIAEFVSFANGLTDDLLAVRAALSYDWSNGQVEGQVHRLKLVKRQMYGRGKLDLLRARVLRAA